MAAGETTPSPHAQRPPRCLASPRYPSTSPDLSPADVGDLVPSRGLVRSRRTVGAPTRVPRGTPVPTLQGRACACRRRRAKHRPRPARPDERERGSSTTCSTCRVTACHPMPRPRLDKRCRRLLSRGPSSCRRLLSRGLAPRPRSERRSHTARGGELTAFGVDEVEAALRQASDAVAPATHG